MAKSMLMAFVEEMGHDYESLLEGASGEQDQVEAIETALAAANYQIRLGIGDKVSDEDSKDEEEDSDEYSGDEYEI